MMETLVFYLPQFHSIPENDLWWGEGYTEWTAVKSAKVLFEGHYQPHVPLNGYYNLLDRETMVKQVDLMKEYGVDGICFYHYYFGNGKMVLEKPAENLLGWEDIRIKFCFSWANETWARTWSNVSSSNSWNSQNEESQDGCEDGILLRQDYGGYIEWEEHFNYLLQFFNDPRYIKIDEKPVFVIHKADQIACLPKMMACWNELSRSNGFDGVFFVGSNSTINGLNGYIRQEANYTDDYKTLKADYSELSQRIIYNAMLAPEKCFLCGVPGYDDTPRHGIKGKAFVGSTPEVFQNQMEVLFKITELRGYDFVFINAWNEWGEGMHLEPDMRYGHAFLEALKKARKNYKKVHLKQYEDELKKGCISRWNGLKIESEKQKDIIKHLLNFLSIDNIIVRVAELFDEKKWKRVAIYGMGVIGRQLRSIIEKSGHGIEFIIDKNTANINTDLPSFSPDDCFPESDVIIVSVPQYYLEIYDIINSKTNCVISVDELIELLES